MRATICVNLTNDEERAGVDAWFERWEKRLTFVSENEGCGCCVDVWNVDGPEEAILEIPGPARAASDWAGLG
jgi:hypothetical protein